MANLLLSLSVSLSLLCGCAHFAADDQQTVAAGPLAANAEFALRLYEHFQAGDGNAFFSPMSISVGLCMALAGARGQTETEILNVLRLAETSEQRQAWCANLLSLSALNTASRSQQLSFANAVWRQTGYRLRGKYVSAIRRSFNAQAYSVDFDGDRRQAADLINAWAKRNTSGKIESITRPDLISRSTKILLTNTVYFKALWKNKFQLHKTKDAAFKLADGQQVSATMMGQMGNFGYFESGDLQVLEMPYQGSRLSMIVLLPQTHDGLSSLEKGLTSAKLNQLVSGLKIHLVEVGFPQFQIDSEIFLQKILSGMGMQSAFSDAADFSGISDSREGLKLSQMIHKTMVRVNEWGTEAAIVTGTYGVPGGILTTKIPVFRADHPFMFLIVDRIANSILFMGRVVNPETGRR